MLQALPCVGYWIAPTIGVVLDHGANSMGITAENHSSIMGKTNGCRFPALLRSVTLQHFFVPSPLDRMQVETDVAQVGHTGHPAVPARFRGIRVGVTG